MKRYRLFMWIVQQHPMALQFRYLQTMREMGAEQNTTTVFPFPMDLFSPLISLARKLGDTKGGGPAQRQGEASGAGRSTNC
jgi:hypothetical protein